MYIKIKRGAQGSGLEFEGLKTYGGMVGVVKVGIVSSMKTGG
ncbi:MAG: hypothetical protein ACW98X_25105 [Promethearchaeota archaeon]|jgi:hypothetical protein